MLSVRARTPIKPTVAANPTTLQATPIGSPTPTAPVVKVSATTAPRKLLQSSGLPPALVDALLSKQANATNVFARQPVSLVELAKQVSRHVACLPAPPADAEPDRVVHSQWRAACAAACAYHLSIGNGIAKPALQLGRALAKLIHDDVGGYASGEQRDLVEAATQHASQGHTHGHDCFYLSTGSITAQRPSVVGDALGYHTSGYRGEDRSGNWSVGADLHKLGYGHERLGHVFEDVSMGKRRVLPDIIGFYGDDALEQARADIEQREVGSRFIVCITGHYLHAVRAADGAHFLDSQTLTGETLIVPGQVLQANRDKFRGVEVTQLLHPDNIHTPLFRRVDPNSFLQLCPFAWEPAAE
jgi:hypothetical protein